MQQKRIQNRISESRWTQVYVVSAATLVWTIAGLYNTSVIVPGVCILLATYLMMELNNANALIRIYSRMVSCSFLVFATMAAFMFPSIQTAIIMLGLWASTPLPFVAINTHMRQVGLSMRSSASVWQVSYGYKHFSFYPYYGLLCVQTRFL